MVRWTRWFPICPAGHRRTVALWKECRWRETSYGKSSCADWLVEKSSTHLRYKTHSTSHQRLLTFVFCLFTRPFINLFSHSHWGCSLWYSTHRILYLKTYLGESHKTQNHKYKIGNDVFCIQKCSLFLNLFYFFWIKSLHCYRIFMTIKHILPQNSHYYNVSECFIFGYHENGASRAGQTYLSSIMINMIWQLIVINIKKIKRCAL